MFDLKPNDWLAKLTSPPSSVTPRTEVASSVGRKPFLPNHRRPAQIRPTQSYQVRHGRSEFLRINLPFSHARRRKSKSLVLPPKPRRSEQARKQLRRPRLRSYDCGPMASLIVNTYRRTRALAFWSSSAGGLTIGIGRTLSAIVATADFLVSAFVAREVVFFFYFTL